MVMKGISLDTCSTSCTNAKCKKNAKITASTKGLTVSSQNLLIGTNQLNILLYNNYKNSMQ